MWTLRSATYLTSAWAPLTADCSSEVCAIWPLLQPVRAAAAISPVATSTAVLKRFTQSLLLSRRGSTMHSSSTVRPAVAQGFATHANSAAAPTCPATVPDGFPENPCPCTNLAICQAPLLSCGAPDLHRCSARVEDPC